MSTTPRTQDELNRRETSHLIAADKVEGTAVYNRAGDRLGAIDNIMIDKMSGKVAYAVMSFGGFLGIGEKYHAMPWSVLSYDTQMGGYLVNLDKEQLKNAPMFGRGETVDWENREWGTRVHDYYRAPYFWL
ncbi:PRC-barrel domain-containing protein [Zavarzinia sp. CC-PAN008]|uniref:PRC-barrel domain-containing protein n=1 Tax=Zavarzinia sp. CC-PAN008 TaxID=3243332 RepID=UPI003F74610C